MNGTNLFYQLIKTQFEEIFSRKKKSYLLFGCTMQQNDVNSSQFFSALLVLPSNEQLTRISLHSSISAVVLHTNMNSGQSYHENFRCIQNALRAYCLLRVLVQVTIFTRTANAHIAIYILKRTSCQKSFRSI